LKSNFFILILAFTTISACTTIRPIQQTASIIQPNTNSYSFSVNGGFITTSGFFESGFPFVLLNNSWVFGKSENTSFGLTIENIPLICGAIDIDIKNKIYRSNRFSASFLTTFGVTTEFRHYPISAEITYLLGLKASGLFICSYDFITFDAGLEIHEGYYFGHGFSYPDITPRAGMLLDLKVSQKFHLYPELNLEVYLGSLFYRETPTWTAMFSLGFGIFYEKTKRL